MSWTLFLQVVLLVVLGTGFASVTINSAIEKYWKEKGK